MSNVHADSSEDIEPYRILFPMGITAAIFAILIWAFFSMGWIKFYPRTIHATLFYFGFFYAFIAGFLMTAVPRMTGTKGSGWLEITLQVVLIMMQITLGLRNQIEIQAYLAFFQLVLLSIFLIHRLLKAKRIPFPGFYFLPPAFLWAIFGLVRFVFSHDTSLSNLFLFSGEAFILNLICGLGGRLIPAITRLPGATTPDVARTQQSQLSYIFAAVALNLGYGLNLFGQYDLSNLILLIAIVFIAVYHFKIFNLPVQFGALVIGIKLSVLFIVLAKVFTYLEIGNVLATNHLLYLGGMLLITLLIGTRVMLAHGGQNLDYEIKSPLIISFITLIFLSTMGRFLMGGDLTSRWFVLAIWFLFIAAVIWLTKFLLISFRRH